MNKLMSIDENGIRLISENCKDKLKNKKLSPSMVGELVDGCPAKYVSGLFLPEFVDEEEDNAKTRGTLFHSVMENYFNLPSEERDIESIKKVVEEVLNEPENEHFKHNENALNWLKKVSVNGYFKLLKDPDSGIESDPREVEIANIEEKPGLETFVIGKIGNTKREILGFIDRIVKDKDQPDAVIVQDWKSGSSAHKWGGKDNRTQGLKEQRQQFIYGALLRSKGIKVNKVQLIFPAVIDKNNDKHTPKVLTFDLNDEKFTERMVRDIEAADRKLDDIIEKNLAEFSPSALCFWCPLVRICPGADGPKRRFTGTEKMDNAYASQPSVEELEKGIQIN